MIKVLVADDEVTIRKGLKKLLLSFNLNLDVNNEASDGELALDIAKKFKPDIMLVDINMPFLNGLEFLEQIKQNLPYTIAIVISGYDEFEYARKALQLGVFDYLLKPINRKKLYEILVKAIDDYKNKVQEKKYMKLLKNDIIKDKNFLEERLFRFCLDKDLNRSFIKNKLSLLKIENPIPITIFIIDDKCRILLGHMDFIKGHVFYKNDLLVIIIKSATDIDETKENIVKTCYRYMGREVVYSFGISPEGFYSLYDTFQNLIKIHKEKRPEGITVRAIEYIRKNYDNPHLSLQSLSEKFHVSPSYLTRMLREELGLSFIEYLTEHRLKKAIDLLESSGKDALIGDIAEKVGYSSQHYFSRIFKNKTGFTPKQYKNIKQNESKNCKKMQKCSRDI